MLFVKKDTLEVVTMHQLLKDRGASVGSGPLTDANLVALDAARVVDEHKPARHFKRTNKAVIVDGVYYVKYDVIVETPELINAEIEAKKEAFSQILAEKESSDIVSSALGEPYSYSASITSKINLENAISGTRDAIALGVAAGLTEAQATANVGPISYTCTRLSDGMHADFNHTLDQLILVRLDGVSAIKNYYAEYHVKVAELEACTTLDEIDAVTWT